MPIAEAEARLAELAVRKSWCGGHLHYLAHHQGLSESAVVDDIARAQEQIRAAGRG
mgnify:FL=1|jgi:hypothetical protein